MAITIDDFAKVWASQSPLTPYEFSESNYKEGWNFVGSTPPSRQMWDFMQKQNDEKAQWLYNAHNSILDLLKKLIPTGCVQAFAGNTVPDGWLLCDGSAVSRTDYADLYAVIGDTYGAGDGSTTFNLPDLVDKFVEGSATAGTEHSAGLPDTEVVTKKSVSGGATIPAGYTLWTGTNNQTLVTNSGGWAGVLPAYVQSSRHPSLVDADKQTTFGLSNPIYGNSDTVQPPALTMQYIIKC